jgi:hypothetical protein
VVSYNVCSIMHSFGVISDFSNLLWNWNRRYADFSASWPCRSYQMLDSERQIAISYNYVINCDFALPITVSDLYAIYAALVNRKWRHGWRRWNIYWRILKASAWFPISVITQLCDYLLPFTNY